MRRSFCPPKLNLCPPPGQLSLSIQRREERSERGGAMCDFLV